MPFEEIEMKVEGVELKRQFLQSSQPSAKMAVWFRLVTIKNYKLEPVDYWIEIGSIHDHCSNIIWKQYNLFGAKPPPQWKTIKKFIETYERLNG